MYIYIYIYIYTYIYVHVCINVCTYICMYTLTCAHQPFTHTVFLFLSRSSSLTIYEDKQIIHGW